MITVALLAAGATFVAGLASGGVLSRLPTLNLRIAALSLVSTLLPVIAVAVFATATFKAGDDLTILAIALASSAAAIAAGLLLGRQIMRNVNRLRASAAAFASGDLSARAPQVEPKELSDLASSFNEMAAKVEEFFDARAQLVAWASHDLRTPVASMQAMLEALEDGLAETEHYLPALHDQVRSLGVLVDDLFELARIDSGVLTPEVEAGPLAPLVDACLRGVEAEASARGVALEGDVADDLKVVCAPEKVERVLFNLVSNSLRHTPSGGAVAVRAERKGSEVHVSVEDTGEGIEPDAARWMFERFWRGDRARSSQRGAGAGLGLSIARGLVQAQRGRIWAESRASGGLRVSFTLPAAPS